jgi:predicted  nucleic acid-binding Zn-ribbon protein
MSYIVHDKNLQNELNEYLKRMNFLLDNLQSDLSNQSTRRENLKHHQQQITSEINRARTALSGPLRRK